MKKGDGRRFEEKFQDDLRDALLLICGFLGRFIVRVGTAFKLVWKGLCWFVEETKPAPKPQPVRKTRKKVTSKKKTSTK